MKNDNRSLILLATVHTYIRIVHYGAAYEYL